MRLVMAGWTVAIALAANSALAQRYPFLEPAWAVRLVVRWCSR